MSKAGLYWKDFNYQPKVGYTYTAKEEILTYIDEMWRGPVKRDRPSPFFVKSSFYKDHVERLLKDLVSAVCIEQIDYQTFKFLTTYKTKKKDEIVVLESCCIVGKRDGGWFEKFFREIAPQQL